MYRWIVSIVFVPIAYASHVSGMDLLCTAIASDHRASADVIAKFVEENKFMPARWMADPINDALLAAGLPAMAEADVGAAVNAYRCKRGIASFDASQAVFMFLADLWMRQPRPSLEDAFQAQQARFGERASLSLPTLKLWWDFLPVGEEVTKAETVVTTTLPGVSEVQPTHIPASAQSVICEFVKANPGMSEGDLEAGARVRLWQVRIPMALADIGSKVRECLDRRTKPAPTRRPRSRIADFVMANRHMMINDLIVLVREHLAMMKTAPMSTHRLRAEIKRVMKRSNGQLKARPTTMSVTSLPPLTTSGEPQMEAITGEPSTAAEPESRDEATDIPRIIVPPEIPIVDLANDSSEEVQMQILEKLFAQEPNPGATFAHHELRRLFGDAAMRRHSVRRWWSSKDDRRIPRPTNKRKRQ